MQSLQIIVKKTMKHVKEKGEEKPYSICNILYSLIHP
jgi:hypothetical protein